MNYKGLNIMMIIILFLAGCMSQQQGTGNTLSDQQPQQLSNEQQLTNNNREHTNQEAAERLAKIASSMPNVNDATAIVFGNYTVIGIDVDEDLDRSRVGSVKYSVAEAIQHDPYGHYAFVIADGDIMERINRMNQLIREGHPDAVILDELANIVSRYMPYVPPRNDQPNQYDPSQTEDQNEDEMRDIQDEQSNNHM